MQLVNSNNAPTSSYQKYTKTLNSNGQTTQDIFLKGDQIKFAALESSKMTQKSALQADQTSLSSSAKHDNQAVAGTQVATPQVTGTQAGESKKEKQFKIKKVKNKRMQQVASSSGNGFFRNKGGSGHRKMSAANKRGAAALKKAAAAADPQAQPLD